MAWGLQPLPRKGPYRLDPASALLDAVAHKAVALGKTDLFHLENVHALLVLFSLLQALDIGPADIGAALGAGDVLHNVLAGDHVFEHGLGLFHVHHLVEQKGVPKLALERLC